MRPERLGSRRVVASVSGGKDSAALSLHLTEMGIEHDRVFMDTGWEHQVTYEYLRGELTRALGPIVEIRAERQMADLIRHKGMFPSRQRRFCTQELKVFPMQRYLRAREDVSDLVNAVGIRREESQARARMTEWEWSDGFDCEVWRPLLSWTLDDVVAIHKRHGLRPNPLYLLGASRVGCWPCIYARKSEIRLVAEMDPGRIDEMRALEAEISAAAKLRHDRDRTGEPFSAPSWFQARIAERGTWPCWPIDKVVEWSRTAHGGRQFELFTAPPSDAGCLRWGLCETLDPEASQ
jgi:3'-phosphoadenosine 5'-phosphosulfate sulfotransferase (PAPS reductase)/FAD synthetase